MMIFAAIIDNASVSNTDEMCKGISHLQWPGLFQNYYIALKVFMFAFVKCKCVFLNSAKSTDFATMRQ